MAEKEYIELESLISDLKELPEQERIEYMGIYDCIKSQPKSDVQEVRHGKWRHIGGDEWCCSCCGYVITTEGSWEKPTEKYCPYCCAKMDKE